MQGAPLGGPASGEFMALWQAESTRKPSGGRRVHNRKKMRFEIGSELHLTTMGAVKRKTERSQGGHPKVRVLTADTVIVTDPKTGKARVTKLVPPGVVDNPANPHYVRRNIITKGCVVNTELGHARITSRPGQHGSLSAVLVKGA